MYLGSRSVVLSWDSRKTLVRCRADVCEGLLGQHTASPFLDHHELPSFCSMAAALLSNKGMNPLALACQVAHPSLGNSHHCLEIPRPWLEKKGRR